MYNDILYTLQPPRKGQCLQGLTRDHAQVMVTCPLTSVDLLEKHGSCAIYRCITRHGTPYLVYVLPPEADLSAPELPYLHALLNMGRSDTGSLRKECSCQSENEQKSAGGDETAQLRKLLWWLGFLSVILGSQTLFGENLWSLFLEVARILLKP